MPLLEVDDFGLTARPSPASRPVLSQLQFLCEPGQIVGVTGPSGSGKTSLLMALSGNLDTWMPESQTTGAIRLHGHPTSPEVLREASFLVTESGRSQLSSLASTAIREMAVPLEMRGLPPSSVLRRSLRCVREAGIRRRMKAPLGELSGGEIARMNLAAAIGVRPTLLLFDSAFAEIDSAFRVKLIDWVRKACKSSGAAAVFAFSPSEVDHGFFDRVVELPSFDEPAFSTSVAAHSTSLLGPHPQVVSLQDLCFRFSPSEPLLFKNICLSMKQSDAVLLLGQNGSGKSTLGRLLAEELKPSSGEVRWSPPPGRASVQRMGMAPQDPDGWFCCKSIEEELLLGASGDDTSLSQRMAAALDLDRFRHLNPYDVPRCVRKRLSLAISVRARPLVVFWDEPTQYQDLRGLTCVVAGLELVRSASISVLCATHDNRLISAGSTFRSVHIIGDALVEE